MQDKKEFYIPNNFKTKFELVQDVGFKDFMLLLPGLAIALPIAFFTPLPLPVKLIQFLILTFIPFMLVFIRPYRENIPAYKHLWWKYKFLRRQRTFYYRKEGWKHEHIQTQAKTNKRRN